MDNDLSMSLLLPIHCLSKRLDPLKISDELQVRKRAAAVANIC